MRKTFGLSLIGVLGLSVQIAACAQGSTFQNNQGGNGGSDSGGNGGRVNAGGGGGNNCTTEVCDGLDNDCDEAVDEDCECIAGETASCYSGPQETANIGTCKAGSHTCEAATNKFGPCTGEVLPKPEVCNGLDDDCNGAVDDQISDIMCGIGGCMAVVTGCVNGVAGVCVPGQPALEICDGIDNDCDQSTDEAYPEKGQACDTGKPGVCAAGMSDCNAGVLTCNQMTMPSTETCDGLDNDCSGTVDDNIVGTGMPCSTGQMGVCSIGTYKCQNNVIDCFPDVMASAEMCNGLDDDCDGLVDENNAGGGGACDTGLTGLCAVGKQQCTSGMLVCQTTAQIKPETCNGADDDCNGQIDEGNPGAGTMCACGGTSTCSAGKLMCQGCTVEYNCNNMVTDDGDNLADCQDTECALGCDVNVGPCAAGETLFVIASSEGPKPIPDTGTITSNIAFVETMIVKRVVMQLNIAHTWAADVAIKLTSPGGTTLNMSDGNGTFFDNYTDTIFHSGCATPITSGAAPFNGCYSPEQTMVVLNNQPLKGTWTLTVSDTSMNDTGTLNSWRLAICAK
jgi:subtilisin-like proprotein convertase family protein